MTTENDWLVHLINYWYLKDPNNKQLEGYIRLLLDEAENRAVARYTIIN
jgi:hypothetical protein